jgi:hypothetical protein
LILLLSKPYHRFTAADIQPFAELMINAIFTHLEKTQSPEKLAENEFLMKGKRHHFTS